MSKLESAKSAIEAEISHARQGLAYYQSRIEVLEQTLAQLDSIIDLETTPPARGRRKYGQTTSSRTPAKRGRPRKPTVGTSSTAPELPPTPSDYWLGLITDTPRSAAEILKSAIGSLGFDPTPVQVKKLRQRLPPALQSLLESKKIQDSGSRRERRFFKA
ncbi:MAG TPA: hypothetical protein VJ698_16405 [Noviherbaspirillum sp.]|uniref:hypothetical protein n=1 Tax=Noviherbaspirillum sp. TaxID=1926288 RepID=UPI002B466D64|nr:hypothetical protein [Noviherbaspirillum sp.]HJV87047.1 hypothetical protein [Noviherbaspirillum sp.]